METRLRIKLYHTFDKLGSIPTYYQDVLIIPLMSRNACNGGNGETGEKSPASGDLNWMPKVAPWRLAILAKNRQRAGDIQNVAKYSNWLPKVAPSK